MSIVPNNIFFEKFLNDYSIKDQQLYLQQHTDQKKNIAKLAKSYLDSSPTRPSQSDLRLKAWLLLPKKMASDSVLDKISINHSFQEEVLNSVLEAKQFWRLEQLKNSGININAKLENSQTLLHRACELGDIESVRELLKLNPDIKSLDKNGNTPLHLAFSQGHFEIGNLLIAQGANILQMNNQQKTPLMVLYEQGQEAHALKLFKEYSGKRGNIVKIILIAATQEFLLKGLVNEGVDINQRDPAGNTPLHRAVSLPFLKERVIKALVDNGADLMALDKNGDTPLHTALLAKPPEENVIKLLVNDQVLKIKNKKGNIPLQRAILLRLDENVTKLLVNKKVLQLKNSKGNIPLHLALLLKPPPTENVMRLLINESVLQEKSKLGRTALQLALTTSSSLSTDFIDLLINENLLQETNKEGNTPLHLAIQKCESAVVQHLIDRGADVDAVNQLGESCRWLIYAYGIKVSPEMPLSERDKEFGLRSLLANVWSTNWDTEMEIPFSLEGGRTEFGQKKVLELLNKFATRSSEFISFSEACQLIEKGLKRSKLDPVKVVEKIKKGQPVIFDTGWFGHAIQVIFIDNYLVICNRGEEKQSTAIKIYRIDNSRIDADSIRKISLGKFKTKEGSKYFYQDLPASLGYEPDQEAFMSKIFEESSQLSLQKSQNCWWASPKLGVLAIQTIHSILKEAASDHPEEEKQKNYQQIVNSTQSLYKYYTEFARIEILKDYLERAPDAVGRDHELVREIAQKLHSKEWKYIFEPGSFLKRSSDDFSEQLETKTQKTLPPIYTKSQVEKWLTDYRKKFHLDRHFNPIRTKKAGPA